MKNVSISEVSDSQIQIVINISFQTVHILKSAISCQAAVLYFKFILCMYISHWLSYHDFLNHRSYQILYFVNKITRGNADDVICIYMQFCHKNPYTTKYKQIAFHRIDGFIQF